MPLIWCSISGHGFGHAAQMLPVLNELSHRVSGLRAILRTTVPPWFFDGRLTMAWEVSPVEQDIGCVQHGPLTIDVDATWAAHQAFHAEWEKRVVQEVSAIRHASPDLVVALPYDQSERLTSYQFIVPGPVPAGSRRVHSAASIPVSFRTLLASADMLVTKPGYSTVVEAVAQSKSVVYVRRYNFVDEDC